MVEEKVELREWYNRSVANILLRSRGALRAKGISASKILEQITRQEPRPWSETTSKKAEKIFQRTVRHEIEAKRLPHPEDRVRHKLRRWKLPDPENWVAHRFLRHLSALRPMVAPRVVAAVFATGWNRWCTQARWQRRDSPLNICCLGCPVSFNVLGNPSGAEDRTEHYARCQATTIFHRTVLRLEEEEYLNIWLGNRVMMSKQDRSMATIGVYCVYNAVNLAHHVAPLTTEEAVRAMQQYAKEAVMNHPKSMAALRRVWSL